MPIISVLLSTAPTQPVLLCAYHQNGKCASYIAYSLEQALMSLRDEKIFSGTGYHITRSRLIGSPLPRSVDKRPVPGLLLSNTVGVALAEGMLSLHNIKQADPSMTRFNAWKGVMVMMSSRVDTCIKNDCGLVVWRERVGMPLHAVLTFSLSQAIAEAITANQGKAGLRSVLPLIQASSLPPESMQSPVIFGEDQALYCLYIAWHAEMRQIAER